MTSLPPSLWALLFAFLPLFLWFLLRRAHTARLRARSRAEVLDLTSELFDFLTSPTAAPLPSKLLSLTPSEEQRGLLAEVVATIADNFVECNPEHLHSLSLSWRLEEHLLTTITHRRGATRLRAMRTLLHLCPSKACVESLSRLYPLSQAAQFQLLLLNIHASPSQVATLLNNHPYALSWDQIEEVTATLRNHPLTDVPIDPELPWSLNVEMLMLHLAATEGLYSAVEMASRLSHSPNKALRTAAFNVLLSEALFPSLGQTDRRV